MSIGMGSKSLTGIMRRKDLRGEDHFQFFVRHIRFLFSVINVRML